MSNNDGWSTFMQSQPVRLAMQSLCAVLCAGYAIEAVLELLNPESATPYAATVGVVGYYVITVARLVVCLWVAFVFGKNAWAVLAEHSETQDDGGEQDE